MSIQQIVETFDRARVTRSRIEKEVYLRTCQDQPLLLDVLRYAYDWKQTYGLTADGFDKGQGRDFVTDEDDRQWLRFKDLLAKLASRELTGNEARYAVAEIMSRCARPVQRLLMCILNRHLELGISQKTIQKLYPKLITVFGLQLCETLDPEKPPKDFDQHQWAIEPKLDGVRALIGIHSGYTWSALSRNGIELFNCEKVIAQLQETDPEGYWLFDGELRAQSFHHTISAVHSGIDTGNRLMFHVFDVLDRIAFPNDEATWAQRQKRLELFRNTWSADGDIFAVQQRGPAPTNSIDEVVHTMSRMIEQGHEGVVIKRTDSMYHTDRTRDWLKLKIRETHDYTIVDMVEGEGRHKGRLGALVINVNGQRVNVGGGFSDSERDDMWMAGPELFGKTIEVAFQEKTPDGSLRFPVYIRLRWDKTSTP